MIQFLSRLVASSSCDSAACRVKILLPPPRLNQKTSSLWVIGQIGYVCFRCRVRIFWPKAFYCWVGHIWCNFRCFLFNQQKKKKKQQQKRKQTLLWSVKDRAIVRVRLSSVGFRFESSLSAMECAYNSSPLECERRKGGSNIHGIFRRNLWVILNSHIHTLLCVCVCALCFSSCVALSLVTCLVSASRSRRFPTCPCLLIIPFRLESAFHQHFHFHFSNFSIFA